MVYEFLVETFMPLFVGSNWYTNPIFTLSGNHNLTITCGNMFDVIYYLFLSWVIVSIFIWLPYKIICKVCKVRSRK